VFFVVVHETIAIKRDKKNVEYLFIIWELKIDFGYTNISKIPQPFAPYVALDGQFF
jgi:hypothetical protein